MAEGEELGMAHEVVEPVRLERVVMQCDCGGEMCPTGLVLTSMPPQYPHECGQCHKRETYTSRYPMMRERDV